MHTSSVGTDRIVLKRSNLQHCADYIVKGLPFIGSDVRDRTIIDVKTMVFARNVIIIIGATLGQMILRVSGFLCSVAKIARNS